MKLSLAVVALAALCACSSPKHLTYDHGRSFNEAFDTQTDLTRPSVKDAIYPLSGAEAILIRKAVEVESTDAESGEAEATENLD